MTEKLKKQTTERNNTLISLFSEKQSPSLEDIRKLLNQAPPHKFKKEFKNEYEENAYEIIGIGKILSADEFEKLPDIDARTVFLYLGKNE